MSTRPASTQAPAATATSFTRPALGERAHFPSHRFDDDDRLLAVTRRRPRRARGPRGWHQRDDGLPPARVSPSADPVRARPLTARPRSGHRFARQGLTLDRRRATPGPRGSRRCPQSSRERPKLRRAPHRRRACVRQRRGERRLPHVRPIRCVVGRDGDIELIRRARAARLFPGRLRAVLPASRTRRSFADTRPAPSPSTQAPRRLRELAEDSPLRSASSRSR